MPKLVDTSDAAANSIAVLLAHPAVADAHAERSSRDTLTAWVVPQRGRGRTPASGTCTVVTENGGAIDATLIDVSFDGLRIRCLGSPPDVGEQVQLVIESAALGGIDGRLGVVRWRHGRNLGIAFHGNFDEAHDLVRFVQKFIDFAGGARCEEPEFSPLARANCEVPCVVHLGLAGSCAAKTVDLSSSGVLLELALAPSVDWRNEPVSVELELPGAPRLQGVVVRQDGASLGIGLNSDPEAAQFLCDLVRASVRDTTVSRAALQSWLRAHDIRNVTRIEVVDALPRHPDGGIDYAQLAAHRRR